jgi:hypothetical protein
MSSQGDHGASSDDELDPDEPRTPLWLPLAGLCLFVAALIYFLVGQKPAPAPEAPAASASAAAAAPAQPTPPQ